MKRFFMYLSAIILVLIVFFVVQNYPLSSPGKNLPRLADTVHLKQNFERILNNTKPRHYKNVEVLDTVAERIRHEFSKYTHRTGTQEYKVSGNTYKNVFATFGPADAEVIVIGAHYDVCGEQDGADDGITRLLRDHHREHRGERQDRAGHARPDERVARGHEDLRFAGVHHLGDELGRCQVGHSLNPSS